jgi:hypothetical protein
VLAVLQKMLFALGVSTFYTGIVQGLVLILAVLIGLAGGRLAGTPQVRGQRDTSTPVEAGRVQGGPQ